MVVAALSDRSTEMSEIETAFKGEKVLITGGLGFIGSNLAYRLVDLQAKVSIVDCLLPQAGGNLFNVHDIKDRINVTFADIRDTEAMNERVIGQDYIFNLAAQLSHVDSLTDPFTDLDINCRGHLTLLQACQKYNPDVKIIYAGTRSQYGKIEYIPVDEQHPVNPTDTNGISKHAAEQYHILYNNLYGIKATSLRLTNTYGPRHQMKHSRQGFLNWFLRLAMDAQTIKIFGNGKQIRDFNYVDDVVEAMLMVAVNGKADGEVFNLGGSTSNLIDLVRLIIKFIRINSSLML